MMTPDGFNARETQRKRDEALRRREQCRCKGQCDVPYDLETGEPAPDSIPPTRDDIDKALRDLMIGLGIAVAYMVILVALIALI